jgi:DNA-binding NarL/FixJ family response regulator
MKVLLVDDHPLILEALRTAVSRLGDTVSVTAADGARAARDALVADPHQDLLLLDLALGDADGFEVLREFRARWPVLPIVVVSASERASDVIRAIDLGAMGFVPKTASTAMLVDALRIVLDGGIYVPTMTLGAGAADDAAPAPAAAPVSQAAVIATIGLTPRQKDVLAGLLQGRPNKLIARDLNLSVETVKDHVAAVLRALGVSSRTQAVVAVAQLAQRRGTVGPGWRTTQA